MTRWAIRGAVALGAVAIPLATGFGTAGADSAVRDTQPFTFTKANIDRFDF